MKKILLLALLIAATANVFAQNAKKNPPSPKRNYEPHELKINPPARPAVPPAENPFDLPDLQLQPLPKFVPLENPTAPQVRITRGENGLPILFEGKTEASGNVADLKQGALDYLASLQPAGIAEPLEEFVAKRMEIDHLGNAHIRLEQVFKGVPVYGGEVIAHARSGAFDLLNGRYFPTPQLASVAPALDADRAIDQVKQHIGPEKIKTDWTAEELNLFKIEPFKAELVVYHHDFQLNSERLTWHVEAYPNLLSRVVYFVDANNGEIIHHYDFTCKIDGGFHASSSGSGSSSEQQAVCPAHEITHSELPPAPAAATAPPPGTATGIDLLGVNQTFGVWKEGSTSYLEDASQMMFKPAPVSTMPGDPVGAIITLNAKNTAPQNQNFDYDFFTTTSNPAVFSNSANSAGAVAVSGHWNSIKSYQYFETKHGRNSIDGVGGNILAFVNVADDNGTSMENAFWNGAAMWYGNGGTFFKKLARGLDVGGHEMTHGVVEKTANLIYQNESGALNESFADVFGVMIDPNDWKVGEDVMQTGVSPNGCLRDLSNPANGDTPGGGNNLGGNFWQPGHVNQQYTGSADNGGVHKNSGIPNHAFYLFANSAGVGIPKAEQVYYKALKDYLVKSSKFVDCRIAVIQAATDLYGNTVGNAAAAAFTAVGIGGSQPSGNYLGQLPTNPGSDFVLCVTDNFQTLEVRNGNGQFVGTVYNQGLQSRPSISDDGQQVVFVNTAGHIIYVDLAYSPSFLATVNPPLSSSPVWRNAAISKKGTFIAALTESSDNLIYVYDVLADEQVAFVLYNPTYSQDPTVTGEVQYADVLEFDYTGKYIMYDAFNELTNTTGGDNSYWDIGFLQFLENGGFAPTDDAFISKLFSGLPERTSVGNPAFSKNSPYVIAFDFIDETNAADVRYDIYGANVETGDYNTIMVNNGDLGWPSYNRLDNALIYQGPDGNNVTNIYKRGLNPDKISGQNNETQFIANRQWAVWFANGVRNLNVPTSANEPADAPFSVSVSPNPTTDLTQLTIEAKAAADAQISVVNLLGATLQNRRVQLLEGKNQLDLNLQNLPAGTYIVRLFTGKGGATVKVVKQ